MQTQSLEVEQLSNEKELAAQLRISVEKVRKWRLKGGGPKYVKIGVLVRYRPEHVREFLGACLARVGGEQPRA